MTNKSRIKEIKKDICNWCQEEIGTNEWKCLKCQGYKFAQEKQLIKRMEI